MIASQPKIWPERAAQRMPLTRLPVPFHTRALSTWPPSRGRPGIMLNRVSTRLTWATLPVITATGVGNPGIRETAVRIRNRPKLTRGPAIATLNAFPGVFDSLSMEAMPPNKNSVIELTAMPCILAATLCPSSWSSTEANSNSARAKPITQARLPQAECQLGSSP